MSTTNTVTPSQSRKTDLAEIIRRGMPEYTMSFGNIPAKIKKVTEHICSCKTMALGGHVYQCDNCKTKRISYNSCRDRHCPKCQGVARAVWVDKRISELLPVGYFHVVFTLPDSFNGIRLNMKKPFYDILYRSVSETLLTLGKDSRWLGGTIGFMGILHTWGQQLLEHPHLHCIIPGGGIRLDGKKWVHFRKDFLFPVEVMSRLFRGKFLDYFSKAFENKQLYFPEANMPDGLDAFIKQQRQKNWVVYAKEPFGSADQVIKYLGRYTHRIAISNNRLVSYENDRVTFKWKDYADNNAQKMMTVDVAEFIHRYFLHVLPDHFVRIRYYGILSNRGKRSRLNRCFHLLNKRQVKKEIRKKNSIAEMILAVMGVDITKCPKCSQGHFKKVREILKIPDMKRFRDAA
jgi:Putative transposase/Transposase zinc-binding domain